MNTNKELLIEFNNIKNKFYDETEIELKIFSLENELKKTLSTSEKFLLNQINIQYQMLHNLQDLRLIDYIKKTNSK